MTDYPSEVGLRCDVAVPVATITLCRPEVRNAQSPRMWAALREIGASLPAAVRVVVIRADGNSFSAGLDRRLFRTAGNPGDTSLVEQLDGDDGEVVEQLETFQQAFTWQRQAEIITIAAVQGQAIGAGLQLALACDLRVVAEDARFSMRETGRGLVPDPAGTQRLVEAVGYSRALEMCVTGREVDAREALHLGLATIVVPREDLDDAVDDLVAAVTAPPHDAVTAAKALLRDAADRSASDQAGGRSHDGGRSPALADRNDPAEQAGMSARCHGRYE